MTARRAVRATALALGLAVAACGAARSPARSPAHRPPAATPPPSSPPALPGTWAGLGRVHPLWIARNRPGPVSDPSRPAGLAYCAPGAVRLSHDGGRSWSSLPTVGVAAATAGTPFPVKALGGAGSPTCAQALADPGHPRSAYAVFAAGAARYGMPPVYSIPLVTTDGGHRWRVVAPPAGFGPGDFGGFRVTGRVVLAIFGRSGTGAGGARAAFGVVASSDGGAAWRSASLRCPAAGPCVAWGPAASGTGSCAMHAYPQAIEASADGGRTWRTLRVPGGSPPQLRLLANGCFLNELVGLSATRVALVANGLPAPGAALRISDDRGASWHAVALPALPGGSTDTNGLQMLPSGALLAPVFAQLGGGGFGFRLELLQPRASHWCTVPGLTPVGSGTDPATLQAAGGRLWWLQSDAHAAPEPKHVARSALHC